MSIPREDTIDPKILRADVGAEILPLRIFRIGRRLNGIRPNMAKGARHSDTVGPDQLFVVVIARIVVKTLWIPTLRCGLVKVRVGKEAQADNAGWVAVERSCGNIFSACTDDDTRIFGVVLEGVCGAVCATLRAIVRSVLRLVRWPCQTGLVDEAEIDQRLCGWRDLGRTEGFESQCDAGRP